MPSHLVSRHYAINRDLLALKIGGGWSSVALVERYGHFLPAGHEAAIRSFWTVGTMAAPSSLLAV
jgi:hypothetical protein